MFRFRRDPSYYGGLRSFLARAPATAAAAEKVEPAAASAEASPGPAPRPLECKLPNELVNSAAKGIQLI